MPATDPEKNVVPPTEQRGGTTEASEEATQKGDWVDDSDTGIVPPELGGSDAPREMLDDDPQLGSSVLGQTTGSDEPATDDGGVDLSGGDNADATEQGGPDLPPEGVEPPQAHAPAASREPDAEQMG
ncbi:MAG: hypothetical protein QOE27_1721 [Solirubrobacteraceae bacterium]|jgi:hypothetical protein|nr:hypothetical protein [Solirubrobacteraceae bacterium]MEA2354749.1 hypothetical protein [Solirubrobacteraceae bacterium]